MSERFSPALRSTDLNDFIAPSQACIVSLKGAKSAVKPEHPENLSHQLPPSQIERVQINLHDCLACSGCITSAETVMLQQQSLEEFLSHLESKEKCVIVSISPQSRASLANYFGLSPLQIQATSFGSKTGWATASNAFINLPRPDKVYHVTVMPCYDKKLEAARDDFTFPHERQGETIQDNACSMVAEVDSVLTSGEVLGLIQRRAVDFKSLEEAPLDGMLTNVDDEGQLYGVSGGSGGYAETVFRNAAKMLFGKTVEGHVDFKIIRNSDFQEATLEVEGRVVLKFARCYGFRNLQNVVRKIKMGKYEYDFVEVMACPSGCLNGGGQIKLPKGKSAKESLLLLEGLYMRDVHVADPFDNPLIRNLYEEWLEGIGSEKAVRLMHTEYRAVSTSVISW